MLRSGFMRVAIVGGGCSGSLVAFHLLRQGFRDALTLIEPRAELGRGLAYSTPFDGHLLNVGAGQMSALPDAPSHFLDWLRAQGFPGASPCLFAPRRLYGDYLSGLVRQQLDANSRYVRHHRAEVASIEPVGGAGRLTLTNGATIDADKIVLALGNPPTSTDCYAPPAGLEGRWHASPWLDGALDAALHDTQAGREAGERVLLIGAGQTAIDAALALLSQAPGCTIYMVSRSGHLPQAHSLASSTAPPIAIRPGMSVRGMLRSLRAQIAGLRQAGKCWQGSIDALRPISNDVWHGLPASERRRFHRRLKTLWDIHRSRLAPSVAERLNRYRAEGSVEVIAGRMRESRIAGDAIEVRVAVRNGGMRTLAVDRTINRAGIHERYREKPRPLIQRLLNRGLAFANDVGLGFQADANGALSGPARRLLFTLGPPRRGDLFETIAVPEIRVQAKALASHLLE